MRLDLPAVAPKTGSRPVAETRIIASGPVSVGTAVHHPILAVIAVLLGASMANIDSRMFSIGLSDLKGAFSLSFDEGAWLSTASTASQIFIAPAVAWLATVFAAPHPRGTESGLRGHFAGYSVYPRLPDASNTHRDPWPAARYLRAGDADDHLPQPADQMVAGGDRIYSLRVGFSLNFGPAWSASMSTRSAGNGCTGRTPSSPC